MHGIVTNNNRRSRIATGSSSLWSPRWGLNPWPRPYQGRALPLSYRGGGLRLFILPPAAPASLHRERQLRRNPMLAHLFEPNLMNAWILILVFDLVPALFDAAVDVGLLLPLCSC